MYLSWRISVLRLRLLLRNASPAVYKCIDPLGAIYDLWLQIKQTLYDRPEGWIGRFNYDVGLSRALI